MNDEHSRGSGSGPGSGRLWTDPREAEEHTPWLEPNRRVQRVPSPPPLRPSDNGHRDSDDDRELRRRRTVGILVGTLLAALLIGAGVLGANLLRGDDEQQPAALPVAPGAAPADQRTRSIRAIYAAVKDSVVPVRVSGALSNGSGTGFVIDEGGVIVTNAHVVKDAREVGVRIEDKGDYLQADVLGVDEQSDLAVLRVRAGAAAKLKPLRLAESDTVRVGDATLAVGFPLGLNRSASASSGIVSGVGRSLPAGNSPFKIERVIQTDAAINPGNSGGPLLDSAGRVIGVNTAILTAGGGGSVGVGFAVPSNMVRKVVPRLESGRSAQHAYLGVSTREFQSGPGAYLAEVVPGAPASASGLRIGDVIVAIDGEPVVIPEDISIAIEDRKPGDTVAVEVQRAGAREVVQVTLGNRPAGTGSAPTTP